MKASALDEQVSGLLHEGVRAAAEGHFDEAFKAIASIDVAGLRRQRDALRAQFRHIAPGVSGTSEEPSGAEVSTVENDSYYCGYCGKRTIETEVLKLFSSAFPGILPWEPNWRYAHVVYWTHSASVEHHVPRARGGDVGRINCIRTCYQCNDLKRHRLISELEWGLFEPEPHAQPWDGLTGYLAKVERALSAVHRERVLPKWMRSQVAHLTLSPLQTRDGPVPSSMQEANRASRTPRATNMGRTVAASELKEGHFVRVQLPGKKSRRSYRVVRVQNDLITLNEMWRSGTTWVASNARVMFWATDLGQVEVVSENAPTPA